MGGEEREQDREREWERACWDQNRKTRSHGFNPARRIGACTGTRTGKPVPTDSTPYEESLTAELTAGGKGGQARDSGRGLPADDSGKGLPRKPDRNQKPYFPRAQHPPEMCDAPPPPAIREAFHIGKPKNSPPP